MSSLYDKKNVNLRLKFYTMEQKLLKPDYIFEASWEVCNKVGGIYTVLSSRAKTLQTKFSDHVIFVGPDVWKEKPNALFVEDEVLLADWREAAEKQGLGVRIGRWQVPGMPIAVLVDFEPFFEMKDALYAAAWNDFGVDSLRAYGDYDESSMFSYAAGRFVEIVFKSFLEGQRVVYQAHEWMSGLGMLHLAKNAPAVATIFTTHATSIGRSIAGNNKQLYAYFSGYNGDQMAAELSMEAKHSIEKQSAHHADCFTTVSRFTDRECAQLLDKPADVVLPNGFESDFVPKKTGFARWRKEARATILNVVSQLVGETLPADTLIVSTSGRNDFRCKGFDVYLEAMAQLNAQLKQRQTDGGKRESVLALIEVPCWTKEARTDLRERIDSGVQAEGALADPMITHTLFNQNEDRILCLIKQMGLWNTPNDPVKVVLVPCYLEGNDGIFNLPYYQLLTANDLSLYPSYYEPWGYTPLESCAFNTPCITTDLSGFGQWVNEVLGHEGTLQDGVRVIPRTDGNYYEVAADMCACITEMLDMKAAEVDEVRKNAAALAAQAQWKHFIKHYYEAYAVALNKAAERVAPSAAPKRRKACAKKQAK